jgi:hypothetical protein
MLGSGSSVFTDHIAYQASVRDLMDLDVTPEGGFRVRLTRAQLPHVHMLHAREARPRSGEIVLPSKQSFLMFSTRRNSSLICDGVPLHLGEMVYYSGGERLRQETTAACCWGCISLPTERMLTDGRTFLGQSFVPPTSHQVLCPPTPERTRLLRQFAQVGSIAEKTPGSIAHPEVARALEQELISTLVACLETDASCDS